MTYSSPRRLRITTSDCCALARVYSACVYRCLFVPFLEMGFSHQVAVSRSYDSATPIHFAESQFQGHFEHLLESAVFQHASVALFKSSVYFNKLLESRLGTLSVADTEYKGCFCT
jgi:hypothetical protein